MNGVLQDLRKFVLRHEGAGLTDGQLLECFLRNRLEGAFTALVQRHGPMVMGVCCRVLPNVHDAEDAFQATFLVLARKAAGIVPPDAVAAWLHGVAYRTARKAKAMTARRRLKERQFRETRPTATTAKDAWEELQPLLDEELSRLPEKYQSAIVLCDLEGKTKKEAAGQLRCPEGTLSSRLTRGRRMLAKRLARRGVALPAGSLAVLTGQGAASACVRTSLVVSTGKAAALFAGGHTTDPGAISPKVAALTEGVLKAMLLTKLKIATVVMLALGVLVASAGLAAYHALAAEPPGTKKDVASKPDAPKPQALQERVFVGHSDGIGMVAISRDGRLALSGGLTYGDGDPTVRLWDLETGKELKRLEGHTDGVYGVAFSPDGKRAASAGDTTIRLWDLETGKELKRFEGHEGAVDSVAFSPDGKFLLSAGDDNTLRLWEVESGKEVRRFEGHTERVYRAVFSPDGKRALSGGFDKTLRYWEVETGKELRCIEVDTTGVAVATMAFSPDGKRAVSSAGDKTVRLWDLESGNEIRRFEGHAKIVHFVAMSSNGKRILTGSHDQTVRLWDVESGKELARFFGHLDFVREVAFSPDGRYALSGSMDKTLRLWRLPPD
jgi:RNA polymerase sigma factor (sigma-70 family)